MHILSRLYYVLFEWECDTLPNRKVTHVYLHQIKEQRTQERGMNQLEDLSLSL